MRLRPILALLLALAVVAPPALTLTPIVGAQEAPAEIPPLPRPRPDPATLRAGTPEPSEAPSATPATEAITAATSVPQPVSLNARITEDGMPIPDGLIWRVFDTQPDASGEFALIVKSELGSPTIELPPGEYRVHLAYGRAQVSEVLSVAPGPNEKSFVLEAGALRLNSAVSGDIAVPAELLKFDIFANGDQNNRVLVAEGLQPNEITTLNAGTYHIVSYFGTVNAVVRADLRVEPGQLTDATLYHHASQVSFRLVSEEGGSPIADVEWTVKAADGTTVFSNLGAFPSTVLAEGEYLVLARLGNQVVNREFLVQPGASQEVEVLTGAY